MHLVASVFVKQGPKPSAAWQMTNGDRNLNARVQNGAKAAATFFRIRASSFIRNWSFVLRDWPTLLSVQNEQCPDSGSR
jgi:hypothetical protein